MSAVTFRHRCSLCGRLLSADEIQAHLAEERAKPSWPGTMTLTRVDLDAMGNPVEPQ